MTRHLDFSRLPGATAGGRLGVFLVVLVSLTPACRGQQSKEAPIHPIRNMYQQPRYNVQGASEFFADGRAMRPLPAFAIAQEMEVDLPIATGRTEDDAAWLPEIPNPVRERFGGLGELVVRGQERYDIYCSPCHDHTGGGRGLVAVRADRLGNAALVPPSLHDERIRQMPDGQVFATISNGIRNMPAYAHHISTDDRWAIVGYVRALQLSQGDPRQALNVPTQGNPPAAHGPMARNTAVERPGTTDRATPTPEAQQ